MKYKLFFSSGRSCLYDNYDNTIVGLESLDGERDRERKFKTHISINKNDKIFKIPGNIEKLEISLGSKCNMHCWYCRIGQESGRGEQIDASLNKVDDFIARLKISKISPRTIRFIGWGEPLVYWKTLRVLVPKLHDLFINCRFQIITNGLLLSNREICDFLIKYNFIVSISHDGPKRRDLDIDIFDNDQTVSNIKYIKNYVPVIFKSVISSGNTNVISIYEYFIKIFGKDVIFDVTPIKYGNASKNHLINGVLLSNDDLRTLTDSIYELLQTSYKFKNYSYLTNSFNSFKYRILNKCNLDTVGFCNTIEYGLQTDIDGNVYLCHCKPVDPNGKFPSLNITPQSGAQSFHNRKYCSKCLMLQLCGGKCLMQNDEQHLKSCPGEYAYYLGIFKSVFKCLFNEEFIRYEIQSEN